MSAAESFAPNYGQVSRANNAGGPEEILILKNGSRYPASRRAEIAAIADFMHEDFVMFFERLHEPLKKGRGHKFLSNEYAYLGTIDFLNPDGSIKQIVLDVAESAFGDTYNDHWNPINLAKSYIFNKNRRAHYQSNHEK